MKQSRVRVRCLKSQNRHGREKQILEMVNDELDTELTVPGTECGVADRVLTSDPMW